MTPTPAEDEPEYLKVEEVAARLKLKEKTIRDWILRGELPAYKLGKEWRIRRDDFDQAMQARRTTAGPAPSGGSGIPTILIASNGSLQPLKPVCILQCPLEDLDMRGFSSARTNSPPPVTRRVSEERCDER